MQIVESLTDEQRDYLYKLECDVELSTVVPLHEQIDRVKELVAAGEKVVLISDMYLPKDVITKMLEKADPELAKLEMFLSNEYGVLKTDRLLFFEVYRSIKPYYYFSKWIHTGDNVNADQTQPRKMLINTRLIRKPVFNDIEKDMSQQIGTHDAFKVAALQARMRKKYDFARSEFVIDFVAPLMVSYIDWAVRDAIKNGFETLYFVSRDGHPLKRIADALIEANGWKIKTKYIYASRRVWRVPSYIDKVDDEFFADYGGNFNEIHGKDKFLSAACFDSEEEFKKVVPQIDLDSVDFNDWSKGQPARALAKVLKASEPYHKYLLEYAAKYRDIACDYLLQEVDPDEKHAYVEFYGRGYNQDCHSRLWNHAVGREMPLHYYYAHVMFPSNGNCIRHRLTATNIQFFFIESLFANMPYKSIDSYERLADGTIKAVKQPIDCDWELFNAMEYLMPEYAKGYAGLTLDDPEGMDKGMFDFLIQYFEDNKTEPFIFKNFGSLVDAVSIYGDKKEFARPYTDEDIENFMNGIPRGRGTMSITMSYQRSEPEVRLKYDEIYQIESGDNPAGGALLKEPQLMESRGFKSKYDQEKAEAKEFAQLYKAECAENSVKNKVTVLSDTKSIGDSMLSVMKSLEAQNTFEVVKFLGANPKKKEWQNIASALAQSKYILLDGNITILSGLEIRSDSKMIMIAKSAFELGRKGHGVILRTKNKMKYQDFLYNLKADVFDCAADVFADEIRGKYALNPFTSSMIKGSAITDVYMMEDYRKQSFNKLYNVFPEAKGKKILLYIPNLRNKDGNKRYFELLDIELLQKLIGDEYVVVIDTRNHKDLVKVCANTLEVKGFSKLINSDLRLREMIVASDVIVGDFRDVLYESVLLEKPIFFTGFDYEIKQQKDVNFIRDLARIDPFPGVRTSEALAEAMKHLDSYDYAPLHEFRDKYLTYCDGHVGERIVKFMLNGGKED